MLIGLIILPFATSISAQVLEGTVLNESRIPLSGATVSLSPGHFGTNTSDNGEFRFSNIPPGEVQITVTFIGYKSQSKTCHVSPTTNQPLHFVLQVATTGLSEVSVIGNAVSSLNTEEISGEYLQRIQAIDMKDIFVNLPSVAVGGGGANAQRLYLRGVEGSNLNISIDGAKQGRSLFQHRGNAGSIDPGLLKQVSVSTGADATKGSGSMGGSISFETIDAQDLQYKHGNLGGKISSGLTGASAGHVSRVILGSKLSPHMGILAAASNDDQDNYRTADAGIAPYTAAKAQNYFAKLSILNFESQNLRLSAGYNRNSGNYISGGAGSDMGMPSDTLTAAYQEMTRETYTLDYRLAPGNAWVDLRATVYYNNRNLDNKTSNLDVTSKNLGGNLQNTFNFSLNELKSSYTLGTDIEKEDGQSISSIDATEKTNTSTVWGLFFQGSSTISIFSLSYGIRWDDYQSDLGPVSLEGNKFSPNAGLTLAPVKGLQLFANYSQSVRAYGTIPIQWMANITEETNFNDGKAFKPETSTMQEAGVRYLKQGVFSTNDKLVLSVKGFKTEMDNLIERVGGGGGLVTKIWNDTLGVVSSGYEASLNWQLGSLQTRLNYMHLVVEDATGAPIGVSRRKAAPSGDRFNLNLLWQANQDIQLGYTLNAVSELKDVYETARPGYVLHGLQTNWTPRSVEGLMASFAVNNLLNKHYSEQTSIASGDAIIPEPGRDIRVTFTYSF